MDVAGWLPDGNLYVTESATISASARFQAFDARACHHPTCWLGWSSVWLCRVLTWRVDYLRATPVTIIFPPFIPPGFFRQPFFENNNNACGWEAGTVCRGHLHLLNTSSQCVQK